jgi:phage regulator Rha-like protein
MSYLSIILEPDVLVAEPQGSGPGYSSDRWLTGKMLSVRGQYVLLDHDVAELFEVGQEHFHRIIEQHIDRFQPDLLLKLTEDEVASKNRSGNLNEAIFRWAFTERGLLIVANLLATDRAIIISRRIADLFVRMRAVIHHHSDILLHLERLEKRVSGEAPGIQAILDDVKKLFDRPIDRPLNPKADHE